MRQMKLIDSSLPTTGTSASVRATSVKSAMRRRRVRVSHTRSVVVGVGAAVVCSGWWR
jgi:hypothetical protein